MLGSRLLSWSLKMFDRVTHLSYIMPFIIFEELEGKLIRITKMVFLYILRKIHHFSGNGLHDGCISLKRVQIQKHVKWIEIGTEKSSTIIWKNNAFFSICFPKLKANKIRDILVNGQDNYLLYTWNVCGRMCNSMRRQLIAFIKLLNAIRKLYPVLEECKCRCRADNNWYVITIFESRLRLVRPWGKYYVLK